MPVGRPLLALLVAAVLAAVPAASAESTREATAGVPESAAAKDKRRPILITVDDLPIGGGRQHQDTTERLRITESLLEVLARHRIRAVAFVIWGQVQGPADEALLSRWVRSGHELGNHSQGHLDFTRTDAAAYIADLEKGREGLQAFLAPLGGRCRFFRFPMLREGETLEKLQAARDYLEKSGQRNLPVTIDNQDWSFEAPFLAAKAAPDPLLLAVVGADYLAALRAAVRHHEATGDGLFGRKLPQVLLLHANAVGAAHWDTLFSWLSATGHRFATADEVLADPAFAEAHGFVGRMGPGLWDRLANARDLSAAEVAVRRLLSEQSAAWSSGDLDAFCSVYADDALFISPSGAVRGRQAVLDRYRTRYPDRRAMGRLTLDIDEIRPGWGLEVTPAGDAVPGRVHGATVAARWTLKFDDKPDASGRTLIVLRRNGGSWEIVQDASM